MEKHTLGLAAFGAIVFMGLVVMVSIVVKTGLAESGYVAAAPARVTIEETVAIKHKSSIGHTEIIEFVPIGAPQKYCILVKRSRGLSLQCFNATQK